MTHAGYSPLTLTMKRKTSEYTFEKAGVPAWPGKTTPASSQDERGFVLLFVLWTLVLLTLVALNLSSIVRTESGIARTTLDYEQAYYFSRGAIEEALYGLTYPDKDKDKQLARFPYFRGMNHYWVKSGEWNAHVAILDEAGKLDINSCTQPILERLLQILGNNETRSSQLAAAIIEWRKPLANPDSFNNSSSSDLGPDIVRIKHRPFDQVEELLLVPGMNREILYGIPGHEMEEESDLPKFHRGLADFVTVYTGKNQINPNFAEMEVLAALPDMDAEKAQAIVKARTQEPFKTSGEIGERTGLLLQGDLLSILNTQSSPYFSIIATSTLKNSLVRRTVRLVVKKQEGSLLPMDRLLWIDEYWAPPPLLEALNQGEPNRLEKESP
jgi:general secretion pathway protein K